MDREQIHYLYRAGRWKDLIDACQNADTASWSPWEYYYYSYGLRRTAQYARGRAAAREGMIRFPDFIPLRGVYCWCLYYLYVRPFQGTGVQWPDFCRAVDAILTYSEQREDTPYEWAVWKMADALKGRGSAAAERMYTYLKALDPDKLSQKPIVHTTGKGVQVGPSPREQWYSQMSRVLIKRKEYDACIALCEEGLRVFSELHYDNDVWLSYRISLCRLHLGHVDEAAAGFQALLRYHQHWILYRGLFYTAIAGNQRTDALKYGSAAMLAAGAYSSKVNLLVELADVLGQKRADARWAYGHLLLAKQIRQQQGWRVPEAVQKKLAVYPEQSLTEDALLAKLKPFWLTHKHWGETERQGVIASVLPNGAGFVREYGGRSYYFSSESLWHGPAETGMAVRFFVEIGQDGVDGQASCRAVDLRPQEELF